MVFVHDFIGQGGGVDGREGSETGWGDFVRGHAQVQGLREGREEEEMRELRTRTGYTEACLAGVHGIEPPRDQVFRKHRH